MAIAHLRKITQKVPRVVQAHKLPANKLNAFKATGGVTSGLTGQRSGCSENRQDRRA